MTLRVGFVEYINAFPFTLPFRDGHLEHSIHFTCAPPTRLNALLREGELDLAFTSSVVGFDEGWKRLDGYCLAAHKKIMSVNLYTQLPVEKLSGAPIGLTSHSASSVELLKVLCRHFWKVTPQFVPFEEKKTHPAFLLIGDRALRQQTIAGYETIDLAEAWYTATSLPFVFATFVVREDLGPEKEMITHLLGKALKWSARHPELLVSEAQKQTGLDEEIIQTYFDLCHYRLANKELKGLERFQELRSYALQPICP